MPKVKRGRLRAAAARGAKQSPQRPTKQAEGTSKKPSGGPSRGEGSRARGHKAEADGAVSSVASKLVEQFQRSCCDHVTLHPECKKDAVGMEKYMRNQFRFLGLKSPARRVIEKDIMDTNKTVLQDRTTLMGVVSLLWEQEEREFQSFGCTLLEKYRQSLVGSCDLDFHEAMETVKKCICTKSWWDTVDMLASHVVGWLVQERPQLGVPVMQQWISDECMWLRRTALLHQLGYKQKTDEQRLFSFCLERAHETEFFIQKAIGWGLRQYSWTNKAAVKDFVERNRDSFAPLSVREALKHC